MLLQIARQPTDHEMREFVFKIGAAGLTRDQAREIRQGKPQKIRNYSYQYDDPNKRWSLVVRFQTPDATNDDLKSALKDALAAIDS